MARKDPDFREAAASEARGRILEVAARLFAEQGFEGASTAAIAKLAGVTQPLVHYYFQSKERLWRATVDAIAGRLELLDPGMLAELADLDPLSQLKVLARRFLHFLWRYPALGRLLVQEGAVSGPRFRYLVERLLRPMLSVLETSLSRAQREGWLKPVPVEHLLFLWLGVASPLVTAPALALEMGIDPSAPATFQQYSDACVEMMFHGLTNPPSTDPAKR